MGTQNEFAFVKRHRHLTTGPILEVGSKMYSSSQDYREIFPDLDILGVDLQTGENVDIVVDLSGTFQDVRRLLGGRTFQTVLCLSVLEHVREPFAMARNLTRLTRIGGVLSVSVPFSWRIHGYPDDYWRFTPSGVRALFPDFDFSAYPGRLFTGIDGDEMDLEDPRIRTDLGIRPGLKTGRMSLLTAILVKACRSLGILPGVFSHPYVTPPIMVHMIGIKETEADRSTQ